MAKTKDLPDICTRIEAAKYLRVSLPVFDRHLRDDVDPIPTLRMGKRFLFVREEIIAWARRQADRAGFNSAQKTRRPAKPATARKARTATRRPSRR